MLPRLIVFDLDGTLIDSRIDLTNSVNATLAHLGKPALPEAVIGGYIGDGVGMLVRRALGDPEGDVHDEEYVNGAVEFFLDYYREHKLDFTYVYDGVFEALDQIRAEVPAVPMAVLTNKPVRPSRDICAHFGLDRYFFQNYGGNSFHTKKPDPAGLLSLMAEASELDPSASRITASETVLVGDSDVDVLTALNCGARSLGCLYGLAPHRLQAAGPDAMAASPLEWPQALRALATHPVAR
ncbi:MAG TPA: HAD hydrolase-like protein [Acidobacteriaceae bacterium]|nr:HAD hydrolase-like protein [Acidobacteriaceae bacterium]